MVGTSDLCFRMSTKPPRDRDGDGDGDVETHHHPARAAPTSASASPAAVRRSETIWQQDAGATIPNSGDERQQPASSHPHQERTCCCGEAAAAYAAEQGCSSPTVRHPAPLRLQPGPSVPPPLRCVHSSTLATRRERCSSQPPEPAECCVVRQPQHRHDALSSLGGGGKQQPKVGLKAFIFNHRWLLQPLLTASKHGAFWSTQTAHPCDRTGDYTGGCFWLRTDL